MPNPWQDFENISALVISAEGEAISIAPQSSGRLELVSKIDHQRLRKAIFCREGDYHGAGPHLFPGVQTSVRALSGSLVAYDRGLFLLYMAEKQERKYSPSLSESPMREYEIRVLSAGHATLIIEQMNLNDCAAIRSARKISDGREFEVWRGTDRIYPPTKNDASIGSETERQSNGEESGS